MKYDPVVAGFIVGIMLFVIIVISAAAKMLLEISIYKETITCHECPLKCKYLSLSINDYKHPEAYCEKYKQKLDMISGGKISDEIHSIKKYKDCNFIL